MGCSILSAGSPRGAITRTRSQRAGRDLHLARKPAATQHSAAILFRLLDLLGDLAGLAADGRHLFVVVFHIGDELIGDAAPFLVGAHPFDGLVAIGRELGEKHAGRRGIELLLFFGRFVDLGHHVTPRREQRHKLVATSVGALLRRCILRWNCEGVLDGLLWSALLGGRLLWGRLLRERLLRERLLLRLSPKRCRRLLPWERILCRNRERVLARAQADRLPLLLCRRLRALLLGAGRREKPQPSRCGRHADDRDLAKHPDRLCDGAFHSKSLLLCPSAGSRSPSGHSPRGLIFTRNLANLPT